VFDKVALISIPVKDQAKAKAFYIEKMGCTVVQEMPFGTPGTQWIRLRLLGTQTDIVLATWFPAMTPGGVQGLVLTTPDIAQTHAALRKRGLTISPIDTQDYGREATFADPDGNGWIVQQPAG
jgi:catechol 2,3-dioxygenase-like lactoylglutathione lyase family enzyme